QNVDASPEDYWEEGFVVIRECLSAAQALLESNYTPGTVSGQANSDEVEKVQLQRVILDSGARRFQAHRIYLRIAAAKRWALNRRTILRGQRPTAQNMVELNNLRNTLQQELAQITDQYVVSDLRAADLRAGHWLDDDPSLPIVLQWIRTHP
ncbi:hypothetical protein LTS12_028951, partial [Elasticomyces elasticus]